MESQLFIYPERPISPEFNALINKITSCAFGEREFGLYLHIQELLTNICIIKRLMQTKNTFDEIILFETITSAIAIKALYDPNLLDKLEALEIPE